MRLSVIACKMGRTVPTCSKLNNIPSKDVHVLIPRTWECVTLHGKRDFVDVIKIWILRWGDYPGLSPGAPCNYKAPYNWVAGGLEKTTGQQKQKLE